MEAPFVDGKPSVYTRTRLGFPAPMVNKMSFKHLKTSKIFEDYYLKMDVLSNCVSD